MPNVKYAFTAVLLMALVTYIPRVIPVSLVRRQIQSKYIKSFLYYVPFAVLGALTFPEVFYVTGDIRSAAAGVAVALILAGREKSLAVVATGSILTVFLLEMFL